MLAVKRRKRWSLVLGSAAVVMFTTTIGVAPAHATPPTTAHRTPVIASSTGSDPTASDGTAVKKAAQERAAAGVRAAAVPPVQGPFEIVNRYPFENRACLDAFESGGGVPGNPIGLFHCTGGATQHWNLFANGSTAYPYWIVNAASGLCLTGDGIGQQYTLDYCFLTNGTPDASQTFTTQAALPPGSGTYILFLNDPTGNNDILADAFQSGCCRDGMAVGNFTFTGSPLQKWDFVHV
jgi:hypothetical protein